MTVIEWVEFLIPYGVICAPALFLYFTLLSVYHARDAAIAEAMLEYERQRLPPLPPPPPPATPPAPPPPK